MKKNILCFITITFLSHFVSAQSSVTQPAGTAVNVPSSACLSCPGSEWNNEINVSAADGAPADIDLMQNGFCFQSSCFYSRSLECSQFGFAVPGTATIVGIEVTILRDAPAVNIIKDTLVQLLRNGGVASSDYHSSSFWPLTYAAQTYGGPTDLWGIAWNPAAINNPATAVDLKVFNLDSSSVSGVNVDQVTMTVYYSTTTGVIESQTSVPNSFSVFQSGENELSVSYTSAKMSDYNRLTVFDISGKEVYSKELGEVVSGNHRELISSGNLPAGIYMVVLQSENGVQTKKFFKQ